MTSRAVNTLIVLGLLLVAGAGQWVMGGGGARAGITEGAESNARAENTAGTAVATTEATAWSGRHPSVGTGLRDYHGVEAGVSCMTCHSTQAPDLANGLGGKVPRTFHQGLSYAHGGQSCLSCHHADDYDSLRLADGRKLAFRDSRQLCAQCHGPQTRDYLNGSHGGMRGYWDKTKGERVRNTCTDCHDVHAPAIPAWMPVFAPRDGAALQQAEREARVASDQHE